MIALAQCLLKRARNGDAAPGGHQFTCRDGWPVPEPTFVVMHDLAIEQIG